MGELEIKVDDATDFDVACALSKLASFPQGSMAGRCTNIWNEKVNKEAAYSIHKQTLDKAGGDWAEVMACLGPDIIAIQIYEPKFPKWAPTNRYSVFFNDALIPRDLVDGYKIKETIAEEEKRVTKLKC